MEWISVNESIPESADNSVLVHFENGGIETVHIQDMFTSGWYLHNDPKPTHWMPLPNPPKQ